MNGIGDCKNVLLVRNIYFFVVKGVGLGKKDVSLKNMERSNDLCYGVLNL